MPASDTGFCRMTETRPVVLNPEGALPGLIVFEVSNDMLDTAPGITAWADILGEALAPITQKS